MASPHLLRCLHTHFVGKFDGLGRFPAFGGENAADQVESGKVGRVYNEGTLAASTGGWIACVEQMGASRSALSINRTRKEITR